MGKSNKKKIMAGIAAVGSLFFVLNVLARIKAEDGEIPKKESRDMSAVRAGVYGSIWKPGMDKTFSFIGLVLLSPLFALLSLAVYLDDPGPVFFTQKRVGKDKQFFCLHKFRTMKMTTPHDVPTHLLEFPEQYITRVGKILRKTSLDELPQLWDIFQGKMSIIGPRPALWNQDDLVAERDKYGANDVLPGLTGWAQINGRDELEIAEKARLDGEYTAVLAKGGVRAFLQDLRCFKGTIASVLLHDGVVEGGTGACHGKNGEPGGNPQKGNQDIRTVDDADAGFEEYGYKKVFHIDKTLHKRILITGADSYIGESFAAYAKEHYPNLAIDTVGMTDGSWRKYDFSPYDAVFHVAGIAHADVGKVDEATKAKYYEVNTDLAIETAETAKAAGVKQFIFMSSMIVYGDSAPYGKEKIIDENTLPAPANFYGDSKWQADKGIRALQSSEFHVAVLRPPMIYGRGSKGNYPVLAKLAKRLPVFPDAENSRSMLYIENLCEFVSLLVLSGEGGVYFPQNGEYTKTSEMVKQIADAAGKKIWVTKLMRPVVRVLSYVPGKLSGLVNKAFGDSVYDQQLSLYDGLDYRVASLEDSIKGTEDENTAVNFSSAVGNETQDKPRHILVVSQYFYPETFRINDMAAEWIKRGYEVTVLTGIPNYPTGKFFDGYDYKHHRKENWKGVEIIRIPLIPRGTGSVGMVTNYLSFILSGWWWKMTTDIRADIVFTFEVSPMTQALIGCWYRKKYHVPHYLYVTDLWPENVEVVTGVHSRLLIGPIQRMVNYIYHNTDRILTCSQSFIEKIHKQGIDVEKLEFWPQYAEDFYRPMKKEGNLLPQDGILNLVFAGNVGYAQGLDILVKAAEKLKTENLLVRFNIIGDGRYMAVLQGKVKSANVSDYFNFIPRQPADEISKYLAFADVLLITLSKDDVFSITIPAKTQSCMACGKPILVSADGEVQNIIRKANAGLCSDAEQIDGFVANIKKMMNMSAEQRETLGANALLYSQKHFNKEQLLNRLDEIFSGAKTINIKKEL